MRLGDLSATQWRSGIAAWLGWLFDGLDMHLYTLVATPFVAQLLAVDAERRRRSAIYGSLIQAAFLVGWALGGGLFGRLGDRLGRARALMLTILTYACFTGLSFFAQTWWQLLICRFLAALGIGGEWAVGAALLSETWPAPLAAVDRRRRCKRPSTAACSWPWSPWLLCWSPWPAGLSARVRLPGGRAAGAAGAVDPPRRARAGRMAGGPAPGSAGRAAGHRATCFAARCAGPRC